MWNLDAQYEPQWKTIWPFTNRNEFLDLNILSGFNFCKKRHPYDIFACISNQILD